ncbi:uncharacterized protein LOC132548438 [Ylistrum balloti]|uniref:uncharacterized protein LOC132548438 n=1 Tax=Ylistrum balloti TaxID=509963 RepID=UPI002905C290|nr:uncharacterized protein LOC132548438 [Ylistrum balloti]
MDFSYGNIIFLISFVLTTILAYCINRWFSTTESYESCLKLFYHYKNLISFYRSSGKWRKTLDKIDTSEETIDTYSSYVVSNLGSDVDEKCLRRLLLSSYIRQKTDSDILINFTVDPKNPSLRKALVQIPYHCTKSCDLPSYNNRVLDDRKISIQEIKKRKHLLRKDFKRVCLKPTVVSVGERDYENEAWKMSNFTEYVIIDGGNHIMDIDRRILSDVLFNANESGIHSMVLTCRSLKQIKHAVKLCELYPGYMFFTAGVHPSNMEHWKEDSLEMLEKYAGHSQCVAIGECGLSNINTDKQVEVFRQQIELACKLEKPLWFCSLAADDTLIPILHEYKDRLKAMCVGEYIPYGLKIFPHRIPRLWELLQMGCYVSVSSTSKKAGGYEWTWFKTWLKKGFISPYKIILASNAPSTGVPKLEYERLCKTLEPDEMKYLQDCTVSYHYDNSMEDLEYEPSSLSILLEIIASCMNCPPKKLASASTQNARMFFNFE